MVNLKKCSETLLLGWFLIRRAARLGTSLSKHPLVLIRRVAVHTGRLVPLRTQYVQASSVVVVRHTSLACD